TISLVSSSQFAPTSLQVDPNGATLEGGRTIALNDASWNGISGGPLTNVDNTIVGAGTISSTVLFNEAGGTIATLPATNTNNRLIIDAPVVSNAGLIVQGLSNQDLLLSHST